jgi:hypothetical protein
VLYAVCAIGYKVEVKAKKKTKKKNNNISLTYIFTITTKMTTYLLLQPSSNKNNDSGDRAVSK